MQDYKDIARAVFDHIDLIAWAADRDGVLVLQEGRALGNVGLSPGLLVGKSLFEVYAYDPTLVESIRRALRGESFTFTVEFQGRLVENVLAPRRDEQGEIIGALGLTYDVTERARAHDELERQAATLREQAELLDLAHDGILVRGLDGVIRSWNRGAERLYGYTREEAVGRVSHALLRSELPRDLDALTRELQESGYLELEATHLRRDGRAVIVSSRWVLRRGEVDAVLELNTDITARKQAEAEQARRQEEIIQAQAQAIEALSTPLIPITDEILVMPLVGVVDPVRARQVLESLLSGLAASRGKLAILDITGVPTLDTTVAGALIQAAHAVRLLGAEVIVTGIRPEVAQTLVAAGVDLGRVVTRGTLQSAIQHALGRDGLAGRSGR